MNDAEVIVLEVPAQVKHVRHVRLGAAAIAADLGLDIELIEDLRVGVNELFGLLLEDVDDAAARVRVTFTVEERSLTVEGSVPVEGDARPEADALAAEILAVVVDEHTIDVADGSRSVRLVKQLPVAP